MCRWFNSLKERFFKWPMGSGSRPGVKLIFVKAKAIRAYLKKKTAGDSLSVPVSLRNRREM